MAQALPLPDGTTVAIREGETPAQTWARAQRMYPEAFGEAETEKPEKKETLLGNVARGARSMFGSEQTGIASLFNANKAAEEGAARQAQIASEYAPSRGWEEVKKAYEKNGLLSAVGEYASQVPYALAEQAPQIAQSIGAARAGSLAGPAGAIAGAFAPSFAQQYGSFLEQQAEEQKKAGKPVDVSRLSAAAAAIPAAAIDVAETLIPMGRGMIRSIFGPGVEKLVARGATKEAEALASKKLAEEGFLKTVGKGTARGAAFEAPGEVTQDMLGRLQAGLPLFSEDALAGYGETAFKTTQLGPLGAVGRFQDKSAAQTQAAEADKAERLKAAEEQAKQTRLAAEQETARKGTPEYALDVAKQLADLEQAKLDLQSKIRKVTANSPTEAEDKAHNAEIRAQLKENYKARTPLGEEKSRLEKTGIYQQAMEQERVKNMTPEDYMLSDLEAARANAPAPRKRGAWQTTEADFAPAPTQTREARLQQEKEQFELNQIADVRGYAQERLSLAKDQLTLPNAQEYADYLVQDPAKALMLLNSRSKTLPGLNPQTTAEVYKALRESTALQQYRDQQKAMYAQRVADVQSQLANGEIDNEQANAYLEQLDIAARDRSEGRTQREIEAAEKQAAMPTATTTQGALFGGAEQRVNLPQTGTRADIDAQIAELERQLDVAKSHGAPTALDRRSNRERISDIMHQLRDLRERQAKIASGAPMGEKSTTAVGEAFGSNLPAQEKSAQASRDALDEFTTSDSLMRNGTGAVTQADVEARKQGVVGALLKEIEDVRGKLKPETITAIEKEVRQLLDNKMMFGQDYGPTLDAISNRWRAGVRRGTYGDTQATPTQTSAGMLHAQMERAFAQRKQYAPEDMSLLERIADSFKAFIADPTRRNMAGEWLNRVTTTGRASPEMTRDLQNALDTLERGKISETEKGRTAVQGELGAEFMPEAVAPQAETRVVNGKVQYVSPEDKGPLQGSAAERYAPMQKGTIFNTPEELDAYLASDYLKEARENQGLARDTVSRLSKQVSEYETKMADLQKQLDALQERKKALETLQVSERRTADNIIADAETQLTDLLQQMEADLGPIRLSLEQAEINLAAAEARSEETSRLIANNVANFTQMDDKVVRAAQTTAAAKAELRQARNKLGSLEEKRPLIEAAQRKVIDALQRQRNPLLYEMQEKMQDLQAKLAKARENQPRTAERLEKEIAELDDLMDMQRDNPYVPSSAMVTFLNNDLQLQMDAREDRAKIGAAKRSVGYFQKKLDKAKSDLDVTKSTNPEVKALQEQIGAAKELGTDALRGVEGEMALLDDELEKLQGAQQAMQRQANNIEDQIIEAGEARTFEGQLAASSPETLSALDRAETAAKDKQALEDFQGRTERLAALPGQRIDFSKRQEMFELVNASTEDFAKLDADIKDMEQGVDELQVSDHFMHEEMLDLQDKSKSFRGPRKNSKEGKAHFAQIEALQKKINANNDRIQSLRNAITQYEKTRATKQAALAKAQVAMSSDPEIYQAITKAIDDRMVKLEKTISGKEEAVAKGDEAILKMARDIKAKATEGKTAPEKLDKMRERLKTLRASQADRIKHLKEYVKEREVLQARRSNRLGITRTDVLTGQKVSGERGKKAGITEQEQFDAELERVQALGVAKDRLAEMEKGMAALQKAKEPKTEAKKTERAERIAKLQADINKQLALVDSLTPKEMGAVSQATKTETVAPAKLRAGTPESKENVGISRRPIVETRTGKVPTATQAVADANEFAERLQAAKTPAELDADFAAKSVETQNQIIEAVESNIARFRTQADALANELLDLNGISAKDTTPQIAARKEKVRDDLSYAERMLDGAMRDREHLLAEQEKTEAAAPAEQEEGGLPSGYKPFTGQDTIGNEDAGFEYSRGTPTDGGQTVASLEKALDKIVGDPGVAGKRIKIFQSVSDLFNDPKLSAIYDGAEIPSDAKAFVNPENGDAFMFADNIGKGEELGVLLHEIGVHVGFRNLFSTAQYGRLVAAVKGWAKRNDGSLEARVAKRAIERVEAAETTAEQYDDELLAYMVEEAIKAGVNPNAMQGGSPIRSWLKTVLDVLRNALSKYGINTKTLTAGDLVNMAYGAAQLELRGTWHGSDGVFTAFDSKFSRKGEGAYDNRFDGSTNLGKGPYTTPNKAYAEYYQHAVPFGKAANASGYGAKTYQDYRDMDDMFLMTPNDELSTAALQSKFESRLVTAYLEGVSAGQALDPAQNKKAVAMLDRLQKGARNAKEQKAVSTLSLQKIKALKEYPAKGNLYRTLDDIPRSKVFGVNEKHTLGERPKLDALMRKYAFSSTKEMADKIGWWAGNGLFYEMRDKLGIDKTIQLLKDAGIDAIEAQNENIYVERAYIDQAPAILGMNLNPVGPATGEGRPGTGKLLFSRGTTGALESLASKAISTPKTLREKMGSNIALEAEMQAVDMRAGVRDALKAGAEMVEGAKNFAQAMYAVLKSDQKMAMVYTIMDRGPLEMYRDAKGLLGYRSTNKNSAKDVFAAIGDLPVAKEKRMAVAQAYLVAQRATNKGADRLDTGALGITEEDVAAALAAAKADPALGAALERVRTAYNAYNKGLIDFMVETKAISKELGAKLNKDGDYVPFYRVNNDGTADLVFGADENAFVSVGDIRRQPYLAQLKGGEAKLLPLDEALTRNTMLLTDKALTNMATKEVAYGLQAIGKPVDKMQIHKGHGPAGPDIIRFTEEPDPADDKDKGQRWLKVDTATTVAEGVPSTLLVKSLEGAHMPLPAFLKLAGAASDLLRAGVTRTPLYIARQLLRDPMAASFTGGLNYNAFTAVLKAGKEYVRMTRGNSANEAKLLEKGLIQSGIFHGGVEDVSKIAMQMVGSNNQSAMNRIFAATDKAAMRADATTRALVYENAIKNGLSEVEADMMTMESMNFYKRGLSPSVQYASRLIPFLNAQIQGLNVLYKAARGKMPFEEQQRIKRKFLNNAIQLTVTGIIYAMAMEDDETFKNARPRDKYSNFFLPIPGVKEPLKLPIPYEAGFFFSLGVAAVDGMRAETDGKEQWKALKDMFIGAIPGASSMGIPQIAKPAFEVWTNKNFLSGGTIEPMSLSHVNAEERYTANTTELAKAMGKVLPLSPIQIEHLVRGYLGVLPLAAAGAANDLFAREGKGEQADKRMSERSLIGSAFQKKYGGADSDVVFRIAHEATEAKSTLAKMVSEGRREEAMAYREEHRAELMSASAAGQYRQLVGRINADARRTNERGDLSASEKRARLDMLEEHKQRAAENFLKLVKRVEDSQR